MSGAAPLGGRPAPAEDEVLAEVRGGTAIATLNRPHAHNALTLGMVRRLAELLEAWEEDPAVRSVELRGAGGKAFCAGGDMRTIHRQMTQGEPGFAEFFAVEYRLDHHIHRFPKPVTALIDGIVMGGGMGLSQGATRRIVGPRTRMAMPETAIGLFPDVGGSYFLARTPGRIGLYLGLTGVTIGAADAIDAGLADEALPGTPREADAGSLSRLRPAIDAHFSAPGVREIVASLEAERSEAFRDWAGRTAALLRERSPTMLCVTHEAIRRGAGMPLADCFRMELGLMHACLAHPDMREGIRARLVDKDNAPRWSPVRLEEADPAAVAAFFAPRWPAESHPLAALERTTRGPT